VANPLVEDLTVKVAIPLALVVPETVVRVSVAPRLEVRVTVFPATAVLLKSLRVTVIVESALPFAAIVVGEANTVEVPAETLLAKVTLAVGVIAMESVVLVAE
jgi:hypothetical protein